MSARSHTHAHTLWPLPVSSPTLALLLCSLYSDHVRPGPCRWPSKERLITGKRVLFVSQSSFQGSLPSSLSLFLSALLMFASHSSSCLYFLLSALFFFLPSLLPLGWIIKARSSAKVQISFVWIVWLWLQTCPCCWATARAVGKCVWIPRQQLVTWKCTQWVGVGVGLGRFAGRKEGGWLREGGGGWWSPVWALSVSSSRRQWSHLHFKHFTSLLIFHSPFSRVCGSATCSTKGRLFHLVPFILFMHVYLQDSNNLL